MISDFNLILIYAELVLKPFLLDFRYTISERGLTMTKLEQVEKLRVKANVSYEDAKAAYEAADGDLLDALIYLEKQGKVTPPEGGGHYSSERVGNSPDHHGEGEKAEKAADNFMKTLERIGKFFVKLVEKGNNTYFEVLKDDERKSKFPVTVLALLLIFAPYITLPLIIIGLFFGFHYRFIGFDFDGE